MLWVAHIRFAQSRKPEGWCLHVALEQGVDDGPGLERFVAEIEGPPIKDDAGRARARSFGIQAKARPLFLVSEKCS